MSVEEDKKALARYRLDQAEESLDEARYLVSGDKSPRSIINRAYYSMFYAILALLIREPFSSSKHSGILRYFNRSFIKTGILDRELGRWVNKVPVSGSFCLLRTAYCLLPTAYYHLSSDGVSFALADLRSPGLWPPAVTRLLGS